MQHDLEKTLSSQIEAMQRLEASEHLLRNTVETLDNQNRELEKRIEDLRGMNLGIKDRLNVAARNKSTKEVTINSKKTTLMADIQGQTGMASQMDKEIEQLNKEISRQEKEIQIIKQLINDHVVNTQDLMLKFKDNHIEQIKAETQRVSNIKESLLEYLKNKKKP
jgi:chaperonin cofactor prefoldin